jgi:hypothetical protein
MRPRWSKITEEQGREKAAKAADGANESGDGCAFGRKKLRYELKYCAVSDAQHRGASERTYGERDDRLPRQQQGEKGDADENVGEDARAADLVGEPSANGAKECCQYNEAGGAEAGICGAKAEIVAEKSGQVD